MKLYNTSGFLSVFFGVLATLFGIQVLFGSLQNIIFGLIAAVLGYIASVIHIFIQTKKEIKSGFINRGIIGMLLSSFPVIILLFFIFKAKQQ
jgi:hypothetical protein